MIPISYFIKKYYTEMKELEYEIDHYAFSSTLEWMMLELEELLELYEYASSWEPF